MKPFHPPITVSQPALPPLAAYTEGLRAIWAARRLTNGGPVLQRLRSRLVDLVGTDNLTLFTNGAIALQTGLQAMRLEGEVITTPFTFAATTNALLQLGLDPVFADIEPDRLTIDPDHIEALITPRTSAILAVHLFGVPCQLDRLAAIASRHGLALIYDAAHAFGVTVDGVSVAAFGDLSMFSFHATKLFHCVEGGALVYREPGLRQVLEELANHGLGPGGDVAMPGTNGKMSELQALMGELMLPTMATTMAHGAQIDAAYRARLQRLPGLSLLTPPRPGIEANHSFMPVMVDAAAFGLSADALQAALERFGVFARRYFKPLVSEMTAFRRFRSPDPLTCAHRVVGEIIALPIFAELPLATVHRICDVIEAIQRGDTAISEA